MRQREDGQGPPGHQPTPPKKWEKEREQERLAAQTSQTESIRPSLRKYEKKKKIPARYTKSPELGRPKIVYPSSRVHPISYEITDCSETGGIGMIYVTGDTHANIDISKLNTKNFPQQKSLSKDDYIIVSGDFGLVWDGSAREIYWQDWLTNKNFTTLFIDGNHENFDILYRLPISEKIRGICKRGSSGYISSGAWAGFDH